MARSLAQWLALQEAAHPKSIDLGLARVGEVARRLGIDRPECAVITVGGTNGKGSTVAHLEALCLAAGRSVGLFTSPHFLRYNERIRIDGVEADDAAIVAAFERIEAARGGTTLTFFEYNTLAALLLFAQRRVELALLEVGLGGRLDATNLIDADVSVVCSVGLDHRDWLGETLEEIGAEKAGIFRAARPAVLGTPQMPASVYSAIARVGAKPVVAERDFSWRVAPGAQGPAPWSYRGARLELADLPPSALAGSIQYRNAATALAALEALASDGQRRAAAEQVVAGLDTRTAAAALRRVRLAGRFQIVPGPVEWILDIAHNPPAAEVLARQLAERPCQGRTLAVVGILGDKDAPAIARALAPALDRWFLCTLEGPRGVSAAELSRRLEPLVRDPVLADSVRAACEAASATARAGDRVVVCGSVHTVGPALEWLGVYSVKERLTGAIILVALIVLLVPELLTGPIRTKSAPAASATRAAAPLRSYTLTLSAPRTVDAAPATPAAQAPAQPTPGPQESPPQSATRAAEDGGGPQRAPAAQAAPPEVQAPTAPRPGAAADPALQVASAPAHPAVHETHLAVSAGGWVVQLGSFAGRQNANRLAHSLTAKGFRMSVSSARAGSRVLWRVRAGPAHDRAAAQHLAARLRALGHHGEILPVR